MIGMLHLPYRRGYSVQIIMFGTFHGGGYANRLFSGNGEAEIHPIQMLHRPHILSGVLLFVALNSISWEAIVIPCWIMIYGS